jgi:hypothetical protein
MRTCRDKDGTVPPSDKTLGSLRMGSGLRDVVLHKAQHDRIAGLALLAAIIVSWNTWKLGEIVARMAEAGEARPSDLLAHVSPLGWEHITLSGEYHWPA